MKTKLFFLLFVSVCLASPGMQGCTTFLLKDANGNLFLGRNYDFPVGEGMIHINERNVVKQAMAMPEDKPFSWVSLYGSISFTQVGKEFPVTDVQGNSAAIEFLNGRMVVHRGEELPVTSMSPLPARKDSSHSRRRSTCAVLR
jgi:penicillin V acylase-like amidase (Ntn superfamily)